MHLVRTAQLNTLTLSQMADQKANILIGATFVVFSLSVTRLLGSEITLATVCLALTAFVSSLFAVLSVLPTTNRMDPKNKNFNILFFGHFTGMDEEQWKQKLLTEFQADETVYRAMLRDVYQNGQVLYGKKYRYLAYAYRIFLSGLFVTMVVYASEFAISLR
ncbi:hypothetical protein FGU71_06365 [Erythrobacter insulae]|uniref:Pycsar effector protein domain-containing protein n=1 Tax=Erythrobacter insulae TaxID=2584124 RepID=A0A547PF48_9SPHN|nr:hypothetical protein FGU71_06365 [Erythrobacter insulae]